MTRQSVRHPGHALIAALLVVGSISCGPKAPSCLFEFAKLSYERGTPLLEAALEGARLRLLPIIMTSFAFIPLWRASGSGAVGRRIMGTTVIGGMLAATLISSLSASRIRGSNGATSKKQAR